MNFKEFLIQESKDRHAVLAFGRLQPPTTGHEVLVNKVKEVANLKRNLELSHQKMKFTNIILLPLKKNGNKKINLKVLKNVINIQIKKAIFHAK